MRIKFIVPVLLFFMSWNSPLQAQFFEPHEDLDPQNWNNLFEEMEKERQEEEYQVQEERFERNEAEVREVLSELSRLSDEAADIGELANTELEALRLRDFNDRMVRDHRVILFTLADTGDQLEISIPGNQEKDPALERLKKLDGMEFEKQYRETVVALHAEMRSYLNRPSVRAIRWPVVREVLSNIEARVDSLLNTAEGL